METARSASYISVTLTFIVIFALDIGALQTLLTTTNKTIAASSLPITNRTTPINQKSTRQLSSTTKSTRITNIIETCIQWDSCLNLNAPDGSSDYEPIAEVVKNSHLCTYPIKIECLTTTGSPADDIDQIITCDLCRGLQCENYAQSDPKGCADYKVRLACLKLTTECPCSQAEIDIVIMLDSSNSVGNDNYHKMNNFCKDFFKNADLDSGSIRVGILTYSTGVHVEFYMNNYNTSQNIMEAIDAIPYRSGATNTADGLKIMRIEMFTAPNGNRNGVTDKVLVLTDGVSNINPLKTIPEAEQTRAEGIHIYAIGIGLKDNQELDAIASVQASENNLHNFDELAVLGDSLFNAFCPD